MSKIIVLFSLQCVTFAVLAVAAAKPQFDYLAYPATSYIASDASYLAPAASYVAPATSYVAPAVSYVAPAVATYSAYPAPVYAPYYSYPAVARTVAAPVYAPTPLAAAYAPATPVLTKTVVATPVAAAIATAPVVASPSLPVYTYSAEPTSFAWKKKWMTEFINNNDLQQKLIKVFLMNFFCFYIFYHNPF